jgi:ribosome maturation factor RimP
MDDKSSELLEQILQLVEPVIVADGKELIEAEYRREGMGWVLRLFIDQEGGITVDDCAEVSRVVGDLLDVADVIRVPYHLEVSSPGLDRPLRKPEHFLRVIGKVIDVRTTVPIEGRRRFKGNLKDINSERILMECDGTPCEVPLKLLERARLCYFDSIKLENPR